MAKSSKRRQEMDRARTIGELIEDSMVDEWTPLWFVSSSGYRWADGVGGRVIVDAGGLDPKIVRYNPLKSDLRASFREFARIEPSEKGFIGFANKYGLLGTEGVALDDAPPASAITGETWQGWLLAHREIADAVRLWGRIQTGDVSDCIAHQRRDRWVYHEPKLRTAVIEGCQTTEVEPLAVARRLLQQSVNRGLANRTVSRVLWHNKRRAYVLRFFPITLLGCMWWRFAMDFTGEVPPGECEYCHKPIPRGPGAHRVSARFCSALCRVRNHRKNHSNKKGK